MPCEERFDAINRMLDGMLPAQEHGELYRHLTACDDCRAFVAVMLRMKNAAAGDRASVPEYLDQAILDRTARQTRRARTVPVPDIPLPAHQERRYSAPLAVWIAGMAACIMLGLLMGFMVNRDRGAVEQVHTAIDPMKNPSAVIVVYGVPPVDVIERNHEEVIEHKQPVQF